MANWFHTMIWNALDATLLALVVAVVARAVRPSAPVRHVLWLLVMLKLIMPPLVGHSLGLSAGSVQTVRGIRAYTTREPVSTLATSGADRAARESDTPAEPASSDAHFESLPFQEPGEVAVNPAGGEDVVDAAGLGTVTNLMSLDETGLATVASAVTNVGDQSEPSPSESTGSRLRALVNVLQVPAVSDVVLFVWIAGTIVMLICRVRQLASVFRLLFSAAKAGEQIRAECRSLAARFGLRRTPAVKLVDRTLSPTVCVLGGPAILLPRRLAEGAGGDVRRCVLAHEMAHLRRRDHWVCWIELIESCVYWWLPTFWWSARQARRAADEAADAWAVSVIGCRQQYAESLLETVEYLVAGRAVAPAWGPALGERDTLARRLTMIMKEPLTHRLSWPAWLGIALVGLLVLPAASQRLSAQDPKTPPTLTGAVPTEEEFSAALELLEQRPPADAPPQGGRRPELPRPPEGQRGPDRARTPEGPGGRTERGEARGPGDAERRLNELEQKVDRILELLQSRQGPPGQPPTVATPPGNVPPGFTGGMFRSGGGGSVAQGQQPGGVPSTGAGAAFFGRGSGGFAPFGGGPPGMGASGGFGGVGVMRGADQMMRGPDQGPGDVERMLGGLELKPEQRERIEHAMKDLRVEIEKTDAEIARAMAELQKRRAELERRRADIIREVLSPEQRERMERGGRDGDRPREGAERGRRPEGDRPREGTEPRRGTEGDRPREGAEGRRGPDRPREGAEPRRDGDPQRPREGTEPRREPGRDRPREGVEPPRRPEGELPSEGVEALQ